MTMNVLVLSTITSLLFQLSVSQVMQRPVVMNYNVSPNRGTIYKPSVIRPNPKYIRPQRVLNPSGIISKPNWFYTNLCPPNTIPLKVIGQVGLRGNVCLQPGQRPRPEINLTPDSPFQPVTSRPSAVSPETPFTNPTEFSGVTKKPNIGEAKPNDGENQNDSEDYGDFKIDIRMGPME